ncbi:MAG: hypothetical protein JKX85_16155 [Phycisphaeraceae bacterium]|nr:hypothetical protein [Phycisphaeraceae bacterium]
MRIITRKLYRAFPELDRFTDDQCIQYMRNIKQRKLLFSLRIILLPTIIGIIHLLGIPIALKFIAYQFKSYGTFIDSLGDTSFLFFWSTFFVIWLGGTAFLPLCLRDKLLGKKVLKIINNQLEKTRCRNCSYSLIGQTPKSDQLSCPECGADTTLQTLGITEEDLIPPTN